MGVERRFECSDVARTAYGACASDGRSADAWTERAPILRGREGVNTVAKPQRVIRKAAKSVNRVAEPNTRP